MRSKSPELMSEIKKYIEDYYLQNRQSPSTTKIAEAVGIARGTAYKYLVEMAEKNMIEYDGQEIQMCIRDRISVMLRSIGMEPDTLTEREKWLLLARMLPLVENNFNLCELGPRSTGKSHLYKEISVSYTHLL